MNSDDQKPEVDDTEPGTDQPLAELVDVLQEVDETAPDAEQNATTISDNNGGRIELDPHPEHRPLPSTQSVLNQDDVIRLVPRRKDIPDEKITLVRRKPERPESDGH
jgi:hypothetical protein